MSLRPAAAYLPWYDRLRERRGYIEALEKWFNVDDLPLMKEKALEGDKVRKNVTR